jgi:hypothetical protein
MTCAMAPETRSVLDNRIISRWSKMGYELVIG